jgi:hypothetical protein
MENLLTTNTIKNINFGIVIYFITLYLLNIYEVNSVIIGVFIELFTIPFLIAQVVFIVISCYYLVKKKNTTLWYKFSLIALITCTVLTISSFFN